jgi:hypothetical protein
LPLAGRPSSVTLKEALTACYDLKSPKAELLQLLWQGMPETARQVADHHLGKQPNGTAATKANGEVKANGSAVHVNGDATAHVHASTNGKATAEGDQVGDGDDEGSKELCVHTVECTGMVEAVRFVQGFRCWNLLNL